MDEKGQIHDPSNKIFTKAIIEEKKSFAKEKRFQKSLMKSSTRELENTIRNDRSIVLECGSKTINDQRSHRSEGYGIAEHEDSFAPGTRHSTSNTIHFAPECDSRTISDQRRLRSEGYGISEQQDSFAPGARPATSKTIHFAPECDSRVINDQRRHRSEGYGIAEHEDSFAPGTRPSTSNSIHFAPEFGLKTINDQRRDRSEGYGIAEHEDSFAPGTRPSTSKEILFPTSNMQQDSTIQENSSNGSQKSQIYQRIPSFKINVYNQNVKEVAFQSPLK